MGTDRLLWSVPDFPRDLALTNDFRTVALYHSLLTTRHSQPLLSSHIGSRSEEPSIVSRPRPWTRPWREREEERERESERKERAKMGTDRFLRSVPDFRITNNQQRTTNNLSYHPTLVLAQRKFPKKSYNVHVSVCFHPTLVLAQLLDHLFLIEISHRFPSHIGSRSTRTTT